MRPRSQTWIAAVDLDLVSQVEMREFRKFAKDLAGSFLKQVEIQTCDLCLPICGAVVKRRSRVVKGTVKISSENCGQQRETIRRLREAKRACSEDLLREREFLPERERKRRWN